MGSTLLTQIQMAHGQVMNGENFTFHQEVQTIDLIHLAMDTVEDALEG